MAKSFFLGGKAAESLVLPTPSLLGLISQTETLPAAFYRYGNEDCIVLSMDVSLNGSKFAIGRSHGESALLSAVG